jgi:energy-coupling factor transport system substrate-specific component
LSWQAGILLMLAATLLAGIVWYERSRPPSQVVALVAALAALAVAGRVVFSPIPNVVPTTDIALLAGYTLGGAPGFAVGALAALVSNFWLGQGPWTPWQMAGWGMTGLLGAGLAAATGRRVGRIGLAVVCAAAGFAYGALLDFSLMVTYGGEQSLDRFLALSARGLPFNIAHAAGNAAFALIAGPALARMLLRYRRRFEFAWAKRAPGIARARRGPAVGAACLLFAAALAAPLLAGGPNARGAGGPRSATAWLESVQNADGGFGTDPGAPSSPVMTGWACLGLEAAGQNPRDLRKAGNTPISYLRKTSDEIRSVGDMERTILALIGAGVDPREFGRDLVARLRAHRKGDGSWPGEVNPTAFGILALSAAGNSKGLSRSAAWLRSAQNDDGGWGFARGSASDPDSTGAALQALAAAGGGRGAIARGAGWLRGVQGESGGFAVSGGSANAQSTAWAVQGLVAAGTAPASVRSADRSPLDYLRSVQAADGHYRYSSSSDQTRVWVTGQALVAVAGKAFPLAPVSRRSGGKASAAPAPEAGEATGSTAATNAAPAGATGPRAAGAPKPGGTAGTGAGQATPSAVRLDPASAANGSGDDDDGVPTWLIAIGGAATLAGSVWGGWILYRRRLP